mmetsp:Transcript_14185/g.17950  ORF Transcript_14185/g.17950 Transcript_14185/m.17950 type:complete len:495 (-) Transcript_14185:32-1516(-)
MSSELLQLILSCPVTDPNVTPDSTGQGNMNLEVKTPLHFASANKDIKCFQRLLTDNRMEKTTWPELAQQQLDYCNYEILELFAAVEDFDLLSNVNFLPSRQPKMLKVLIEAPSATKEQGSSEALNTLVEESLIYGTKEEVQLLLNDTRIDPMKRFLPHNHESSAEINLFDLAITQHAPLFSITTLCDHKKVREYQSEIPPLFEACCESPINADTIQKLLEDPEIDVNEKFIGWTPCHLAISLGNQALLSALLECKRMDPNIKGGPEELTPLLLACSMHQSTPEFLRILLGDERVDVNIRNKQGTNPLNLYCREGKDVDILKMFLAKPLNENGLSDSQQVSPLCESYSPDILNILLDDDRFDPQCCSNNGEPFLFQVISSGQRSVVQRVLAHEGVDLNVRFGEIGILSYASYGEDLEIFQEVIECPRLDIVSGEEIKEMSASFCASPFLGEEKQVEYLYALCKFSGLSASELANQELAQKLNDKIRLSRSKGVVS